MRVKHVVPLPTWKTCYPVPTLENPTADPKHHVSPGVAQEDTGARPVPGPRPLRSGGSFTWCRTVWYHRRAAVPSGFSPPHLLFSRSSLSPQSADLHPAGFCFPASPDVSTLSARFTPSTIPLSTRSFVHGRGRCATLGPGASLLAHDGLSPRVGDS